MPTLQFKGKNIIWNHHLSVPYHSLEEIEDLHFQYEKGDHKIIEGDNLVALKALLPQYAGQVKCVYIDPPYNTGNEGWIYNDKSNSPLLREWIGKVVSKEDLTHHDKWLCMMSTRIKLLYELLSDDGVLYVSIGEDELGNLITLLNEIFGDNRLLTVFSWRSRSKPTNAGDAKYRPQKVAEFIVAFSKGDPEALLFNLSAGKDRTYPHSDDEGEFRYTTILTSNLGVYRRETMRFEIEGYTPNEEQRWKAGQSEIEKLNETGRLIFNEDGVPMWKIYKTDEDELLSPMYTFLHPDITGTAENGKTEVNKLIGKGHGFDTVKPVQLIKYLIHITTKENDVVLDSFAGTGTTLQAVLELNAEDGGKRQCLLVQMTEASESEPEKNICKNITKKRIESAIKKYNFDSGFKYLRVGSPIDPETMLDGDLPTYQQFAEYVYYLATGGHLADKSKVDASNHFVGMEGGQAVYLIYEQDMDKLTRLALTLQIAESIVKHSPGKRRVVFAPSCFLDEEYMTAMQIEFVSVPYNLFERKNNG